MIEKLGVRTAVAASLIGGIAIGGLIGNSQGHDDGADNRRIVSILNVCEPAFTHMAEAVVVTNAHQINEQPFVIDGNAIPALCRTSEAEKILIPKSAAAKAIDGYTGTAIVDSTGSVVIKSLNRTRQSEMLTPQTASGIIDHQNSLADGETRWETFAGSIIGSAICMLIFGSIRIGRKSFNRANNRKSVSV